MELLVIAADDSIPGIRTLTLADPAGVALPSFTPGSHLVLHCGDVTNAYSLTGDGLEPLHYTISVLRVADGSGGSAWMHDQVWPGTRLIAEGAPRSAFAPIRRAGKHLLIGGGIGITPLVSHVRSAVRWGAHFELVYAFRDGHGAYIDELKALAGDRVTFITDESVFVSLLDPLLLDQPIGTHLYVCGPTGLMDAVTGRADALGWPSSRIHLERFGLDALDPGEPFDVTLDGDRFTVPSGTSLLEALEQRGRPVPNMCRQGVCGECRLAVTSGHVLHRDLFLTEAEKSANDAVMCCVSRAEDGHLEVSL